MASRTRPWEGVWTHAATGDESRIIFEETAYDEFVPRLPDGSPIRIEPGDSIKVDVLGAGQSLVVPTYWTEDST